MGVKCLTVLVVVVGLGVMFVLARKKANQVMLAIAATILVGGVLRLFQLKEGEGSIFTIGAILAGLGIVWTISWYSNRTAEKKRLREIDEAAAANPAARSVLTPGRPRAKRPPPKSKSEALGRAFGKMFK